MGTIKAGRPSKAHLRLRIKCESLRSRAVAAPKRCHEPNIGFGRMMVGYCSANPIAFAAPASRPSHRTARVQSQLLIHHLNYFAFPHDR